MRWSRLLGLAAATAVSLVAGPSLGANRSVVIEPGDTLWALAQEHGCSLDELRAANDLGADEALAIGRKLDLSSCRGKTGASDAAYVVVRGDTLAAIASRHGTSVAELRRLNELEGSLIRVGQRLTLPGSSERVVRVIRGQSLGRPDRGSLEQGTRLPRSSHYYRRRVERTWAAAHLIDHVLNAITLVHARHPKAHRLAVGDLSDADGGVLSGHASHQSGRDIDLGLYYVLVPPGYPEEFVVATKDTLDTSTTWTLVEALIATIGQPGGVEKIFLDYELQGWLYAEAREAGWSKARLRDVSQYPDGPWAKHGVIRHEPKHADHLHVRFACAPDDQRCK